MEFSTGMQNEDYYGFHRSDHTIAHTRTYGMRGERDRETKREIKAETAIERQRSVIFKKDC